MRVHRTDEIDRPRTSFEECLGDFRHLESLQFLERDLIRADDGYQEQSATVTAQVVNENAPSLRRLFVYSDADLLRLIEWQSLATLQDLTLVIDLPMRLDAVFSHCSQLRSF